MGGSGRPVCPQRWATKQNNLNRKNPRLAREWHPTKNGDLQPKDVTPRASRKVFWICGKGHEWEARGIERSKGTGCPYCAGKRAADANCLETLVPHVAKQWHPSKNGDLTARDVTKSSNKKVWWMCRKGHEWPAMIDKRTNGNGCPACYKKPKIGHNLQSVNPNLAKEWHPKKNNGLTPKEVTCGSGKRVWWICKQGHEWGARIHNRHSGSGCPVCGRERAWKTRRKKVAGH
jgi:hypothetical protein